jgi:E3 ubiquitin-protein ligase RFWD2
MGESAVGALVSFVKDEPSLDPAAEPPPGPPAPPNPESEDAGPSDMDKDSLCPICMQIISDAFLTACGHSFCYMCIVTHLRNKSDCPCCGHYLTTAHIFPNFLLDKVFFSFGFF